jgi:ribosomal protein S18 acetylase RimI-like enzyme
VLVRNVRDDDAKALSQLLTAFTSLTTTPAQVLQRLARSRGIEHPILVELDGKVVGFASPRLLHYLGEEALYAEISELFVLEGYRRRGIARALMTEMEVRARAAGASSLSVLTGADNETALALYHTMGFQQFSIALQNGSPRIALTGRAERSALPRSPWEWGVFRQSLAPRTRISHRRLNLTVSKANSGKRWMLS